MPEGSSSAAPVIRPGPQMEINRRTRPGLVGDGFVKLDFTVANMNYAMGMQSDVMLVRDQDDRVAFVMQALEQRHDLVAGGGVEVAGGLVGQQNRWTIDQRARNCDTLPLATGELVRLVIH